MTAPTINGLLLSSASVTIPRWGFWSADVEVTTGEELSGQVQIDVGGLQLTGTVIDGAPYREVGWYRIVGGAGGWRKTIPAKAYRAEIGVKLSTVLQDAARECGETLGTVSPTPVGPAFDRFEGEASRVLDLLAEEAWYVDEAGVTQMGARAAAAFAAEYTLLLSNPARRFVTVSAEDISTLLPGAIVEGLEIASVRHELVPGGLRSHCWGTYAAPSDRLARAIKDIVLAILGRRTDYHRFCEYRVTKVSTGYLDLVPVSTKLGLPQLANVPTWGGMGAGGDPTIGSLALVGHVNGDPCRPYVALYEGEAGGAWRPQEARLDARVLVKLGGGAQFVPLDNLLQGELDKIAAAYNVHTHKVASFGTASDTPATGGFTYTKGPTAAAKVKAT